jgi:hypothetical protein
MRIIKELDKKHPDFRSGRSDITTIFAKVKIQSAYPKADDLKQAFQDWAIKYSKPLKEVFLPADQQIKLLGMYFSFRLR